jgi:predicted nucleic acid-binding protein
VTPVILQEILQGAADEREFSLLDEYFSSQSMLLPQDPLDTHRRAARLYFDCRHRGFTPRSTVDCLIAQIALDHGVALLHDDRDFEQIARVAPTLEFA